MQVSFTTVRHSTSSCQLVRDFHSNESLIVNYSTKNPSLWYWPGNSNLMKSTIHLKDQGYIYTRCMMIGTNPKEVLKYYLLSLGIESIFSTNY